MKPVDQTPPASRWVAPSKRCEYGRLSHRVKRFAGIRSGRKRRLPSPKDYQW